MATAGAVIGYYVSERPERAAVKSRLRVLQRERGNPARLDSEREVLFSSLEWCAQHAEWQQALEFREPLHYYLLTGAYWHESIRLNEIAIRAAQALEDGRAEAEYTRLLADLYNQRGDYDRAIELYETSRVQAHAAGDSKLVAECWHMEAMIARARGDERRAEQLNARALEQAQTLDDTHWRAHPLIVRALLARDLGRFEQARQDCETSLSLVRPAEVEVMAQCHHLLGDIYMEQGRLSEAQPAYEASLRLGEQVGSRRRMATTLFRLGELAQVQGNLALAGERYAQSIQTIREMDRPLIAKVRVSQAALAERQGDWERAHDLTEQAREAFQEIGDRRYLAVIAWRLTRLAVRRHEWTYAIRTLLRGIPDWMYLVVSSRNLLFGQARRYLRKARV